MYDWRGGNTEIEEMRSERGLRYSSHKKEEGRTENFRELYKEVKM